MVLFLFYCAVVANKAVVYCVVADDSVVLVVDSAVVPFGIPVVNLLLS